jgi:hypothetical protein
MVCTLQYHGGQVECFNAYGGRDGEDGEDEHAEVRRQVVSKYVSHSSDIIRISQQTRHRVGGSMSPGDMDTCSTSSSQMHSSMLYDMTLQCRIGHRVRL